MCRWAQALQLQERLAFVVANATLSMKSMLDSYPGKIVLVSIQVLLCLRLLPAPQCFMHTRVLCCLATFMRDDTHHTRATGNP